jgi:AcrR family transcriptional regulator
MIGMPTIDRKARRHSATREEILAAAWDLARSEGLAGISMRDLAARVGMRSPSLYTYFVSKHAIYDAMFAQGWRAYLERMNALPALPRNPRQALRRVLRAWAEFFLDDPERFVLLCQRTIPGFEPSPESYSAALEAADHTRGVLAALGFSGQKALDLLFVLASGLISQQIANQPGGDGWMRLVDDIVDMFVEHCAPMRRGTRG